MVFGDGQTTILVKVSRTGDVWPWRLVATIPVLAYTGLYLAGAILLRAVQLFPGNLGMGTPIKGPLGPFYFQHERITQGFWLATRLHSTQVHEVPVVGDGVWSMGRRLGGASLVFATLWQRTTIAKGVEVFGGTTTVPEGRSVFVPVWRRTNTVFAVGTVVVHRARFQVLQLGQTRCVRDLVSFRARRGINTVFFTATPRDFQLGVYGGS